MNNTTLKKERLEIYFAKEQIGIRNSVRRAMFANGRVLGEVAEHKTSLELQTLKFR
jgi:hypothetical protein